MKTAELIDELRSRLESEQSLGESLRSHPLESAIQQAADRLETILKAWESLDPWFQGRAENRYLRDNDRSRDCLRVLGDAITGES